MIEHERWPSITLMIDSFHSMRSSFIVVLFRLFHCCRSTSFWNSAGKVKKKMSIYWIELELGQLSGSGRFLLAISFFFYRSTLIGCSKSNWIVSKQDFSSWFKQVENATVKSSMKADGNPTTERSNVDWRCGLFHPI